MADNYFASVGAIVIRDGKVLLVRHTYGAAAGKLLNPGGFLNTGEMPFDAVKREVLEETGVVVEPVGMLSIRCAEKGWYMVFLADYVSGEPNSDGDENSEAVFMDCGEVLLRGDVTETAKNLIRIALSNKPLLPTDARDGRVMFVAGRSA